MGSPILAVLSDALEELYAFEKPNFADFRRAVEALQKEAWRKVTQLHWADKSSAALEARALKEEMMTVSFKAASIISNSTPSVEFGKVSGAYGRVSWGPLIGFQYSTYDAAKTLQPKVDELKRQIAAGLTEARARLREQLLAIWPEELVGLLPQPGDLVLEAPPAPVYTGPDIAAIHAVMLSEGRRFFGELFRELDRDPAHVCGPDFQSGIALCRQAPEGLERRFAPIGMETWEGGKPVPMSILSRVACEGGVVETLYFKYRGQWNLHARWRAVPSA